MNNDWYCKAMGIEFGPMSLEDLRGLVDRGNIRAGDPVRRGTAGPWIKAAESPELATCFTSAARPPVDTHQQAVADSEAQARTTAPQPSTAADEQQGEQPLPVSLDQYHCAILIGPDGISVCDLRNCKAVTLDGATLVGRKTVQDDAPIRMGPFELRLSIKEIYVGDANADNSANDAHSSQDDATAEAAAPPATAGNEPKVTRRRPSQSDTGDAAAESLRRMFMPKPAKVR